MGLLSLGTPFTWENTKKHVDHIRQHGINQLIEVYKRFKDRKNDCLLWGDELEYMVVKLDRSSKSAKLTLRQEAILDKLIDEKVEGRLDKDNIDFHQEYGRYMLEATPAEPYTGEFQSLLLVEANMNARRRVAKSIMHEDEYPLTLTAYPLMGVGEFTEPYILPDGSVSRSFFLPDNIINTHLRFPTLTANIRSRRGEKVAINVPIYKDTATPWPFHDPTIPRDRNLYPEDANAKNGAALDNHIYMDSMGFGMGCCCLQLTFQATDITEARNLYDQLTPLAPIMLVLSAAAPIFRGYMSDQDVRWNVISGAVDDRTLSERGLLGADVKPESTTPDNTSGVIPKSRYDSVDCYISENPILKANEELYNDIPLVTNNKVKKQLESAGLPAPLVKHFSHLFIRDPLVIFEELLHQDDTASMDHFENIQSTNWQTIRFKPPPSENIGWRVEFRSMDVQITDFENAAFSVFIVLVTRALLSFNLEFLMPMSMVDLNMKRAHNRDALNKEKFWFRTNVQNQAPESDPKFMELSLDEIINGSESFVGLISLVKCFLFSANIDMQSLCDLEKYMYLVSQRASGRLVTAATWMREFVDRHPEYKHDSVVTPPVAYDLIETIRKLTVGEGWNTYAKNFLGGLRH